MGGFKDLIMNKKLLSGLISLLAISSQAFAATGYANDGFELALFLGCFLLLVAGVIDGIGFLNKNGKMLLHRVKAFIKNKVAHL
jgi:hypothetical protein